MCGKKHSPFFSVIMPSFLGKYKHAASNRDTKIIRAVQSVLNQTFQDFEIVIIADGCDKTIEIIQINFREAMRDEKIRMFKISDKRNFGQKRNAGASGVPRNAGLQQAKGEYAIYLDIDDMYIKTYLHKLKDEMADLLQWYWFDCLSWDKHTEKFNRLICDINVQGRCGTANICHRISMNSWWVQKGTYLHDWMFISKLKAISQEYRKLNVAGFGVCHVPNMLDYDGQGEK